MKRGTARFKKRVNRRQKRSRIDYDRGPWAFSMTVGTAHHAARARLIRSDARSAEAKSQGSGSFDYLCAGAGGDGLGWKTKRMRIRRKAAAILETVFAALPDHPGVRTI